MGWSEDEDELASLRASKQYQSQMGEHNALKKSYQEQLAQTVEPSSSRTFDEEEDNPVVVNTIENEENDEEDTPDPDLLQFLPTSFGGNADNRHNTYVEKTKAVKEAVKQYVEEHEEEEENTEEKERVKALKLPFMARVAMKGHEKLVAALALDPSGTRLLSGSYDYKIKFWDFATMDRSLRSFREIEPYDNAQIHGLSFNKNGEYFVAVGGSTQPKIFTRDGFIQGTLTKGDQYLREMTNTKGHVAMVTGVVFDPSEYSIFYTSSRDGTLRIWDFEKVRYKELQQDKIIKTKTSRGTKNPAMCLAISREGKYLAAGCEDGSVMVWDNAKKRYAVPMHKNHTAHTGEVTSVCFSPDSTQLLTRSKDGTMKLFTLPQLSKPTHVFFNLPNLFDNTQCIFSPCGKFALTGTSAPRDEPGYLAVFSCENGEEVFRHRICDGSVVSLLWHPKLNQLLIGSTDRAIHVFYDPDLSVKGILLSLVRAGKRKADGFASALDIQNPYALRAFRKEPLTKKQKRKALKDPVKAHIPQKPMGSMGRGSQGRMGVSLQSNILRPLAINQARLGGDVRETILAHKDGDNDPKFMGAYARTQPKAIFAEEEKAEDEEEQ